jgi:hypothetical protein
MKNLLKRRNMVSFAVLLAIVLAGCNNFVGDDSLSGSAWAGGVVGSNANNTLVDKYYATGAVNAIAIKGDLPFPQPGTGPAETAVRILSDSFPLPQTGAMAG